MDFRQKLLILAASSMAFAGLAYGDACGAAQINPTPAPPNLLRLEGTAELVTDITVACTGNTLAATTGQLIANLGLNVTSKQTAAAAGGAPATYEVALLITVGAAAPTVYFGAISGSTVTFGTTATPVTFPAAAYTMRVANMRVNASTGAVATYVGESLLATNQGVVIYATAGATNVGYIPSLGFATPTVSGVANYVICTGNPAKTPISSSFAVKVTENFGGAFKSVTPTVGAATCGGAACTVTNGEAGSYTPLTAPASVAPVGTAASGTLFLFSFANIASGETIYVPTTFTNGTLTVTLITSLTNTTPVAASIPAGSTLPAGSAPLTSANGAATAVYNVTATDNTVLGENFTITGYVTANPGFATAAVSAVTVTVTPAGTGSINPTLVIPNFTVSSNPALNLSSFAVCTTSLLFPFVTNQLGFDTGIVLADTSTDPFGAVGATPGPGACALNFYGVGAPTNPVAAPGGSQASGTTNAFQLSSVAPGFQGYIIAVCNYLYGHGYAFLEYNLTQGNGVAEGYLPLVITGTRGQATTEVLNN